MTTSLGGLPDRMPQSFVHHCAKDQGSVEHSPNKLDDLVDPGLTAKINNQDP